MACADLGTQGVKILSNNFALFHGIRNLIYFIFLFIGGHIGGGWMICNF